MRFRPLGVSGMVVSVVTLALADSPTRNRPQDWEALVYSALENGVNSFEVVGRHPNIGEGLARAIHAIERRLVHVAWRLGNTYDAEGYPARDFSADALERMTQAILARTGFSYLDAIVLDEPRAKELNADALTRLKAIRESGRVRMIGVAGQDDAIDAYISSGVFNLLHMPYSLLSGWKERQRQQAAADHDMAVVIYDFYPDKLRGGHKAPMVKPGMKAKPTHLLGDAGTYAFLENTPRWSGEAICLAHVLTNPAVASVQLMTDRPERLAALSAVVEKDLPPGVSAQIEMARFGPSALGRKA
jgi:aryl-alcohol dehydrogenase-like predicted oxidoreductase